MEEHDSLDDDLENIQQPDRFDLELELVRWVKVYFYLWYSLAVEEPSIPRLLKKITNLNMNIFYIILFMEIRIVLVICDVLKI